MATLKHQHRAPGAHGKIKADGTRPSERCCLHVGWNPATDNVITHLALVESALAKEVGQ